MNAIKVIKACERLIQVDYSKGNSKNKGRLEKLSHCIVGV